MRLLWLTKTLPYPSIAGDLLYSRHLIEACARQGIEIHVLCHPGPNDNVAALDQPNVTWQIVGSDYRGRLRSLFSPLPNIASVFDTPQRREAIRRALAQTWDGIVFDALGSLGAFRLVRNALKGRAHRPFLVYLSHNHETTTRRRVAEQTAGLAMKMVQRFDAWKTAQLERKSLAAVDLLTTITEDDWLQFQPDFCGKPHLLVSPGYEGPRQARRSWSRIPRTAIVVGSYQWVAKRMNVEALLDAATPVFPAAGIRLRIVGHMDEAYRAQLERRFAWAEIVGPVNDVMTELATARMGIVPERAGGGFKLKLLDYIFGRVVVVGLESAMGGTGLQAGRHYLAAHDMAALVRLVVDRIGDDAALESMTDAAFTRCEMLFDWAERGALLRAAFEAVMQSNRMGLRVPGSSEG
ncbi:MAG: glycosyltransferase [Rhizomicrobium sp.]